MHNWQLKTPVAFLVFNRPETTRKVFEAIRGARPPRLLVVADGPREGRPGEAKTCEAVRKIVDGVDWPCEVQKDYSDINLGCRKRVSSGLDWVFSTVEEAIILEDDCLPNCSFFRFCEELLERYREDERIGIISGNNFQFGNRRTGSSYYFSIYPHIWGWASWRRVWTSYDVVMRSWPEIRDAGWIYDIFGDESTGRYWTGIFERTYRKEIDAWAYQLAYSLWTQGSLTILPNVNLVSNIGFGEGATHTSHGSIFSNMPVEPMEFPLHHPSFVVRDTLADRFTHETMYDPGLYFRVMRKLGLPPKVRRR